MSRNKKKRKAFKNEIQRNKVLIPAPYNVMRPANSLGLIDFGIEKPVVIEDEKPKEPETVDQSAIEKAAEAKDGTAIQQVTDAIDEVSASAEAESAKEAAESEEDVLIPEPVRMDPESIMTPIVEAIEDADMEGLTITEDTPPEEISSDEVEADDEEEHIPEFFANRDKALGMMQKVTEQENEKADRMLKEAGLEKLTIEPEEAKKEDESEPEPAKEEVSSGPLPHWIHDRKEDPSYLKGFVYLRSCTCSECGYHSHTEKPVCEGCGAKMVGEHE